MTKKTCCALALALAACGVKDPTATDPVDAGPPPPALNAAMTGTWYGKATVQFENYMPSSYNAHIQVSVSGDSAAVLGVCPDGSGLLTGHGDKNTATWSGSHTCPPLSYTNCSAVSYTWETAEISYVNGFIEAHLTGTSWGCSIAYRMTMDFTGAK